MSIKQSATSQPGFFGRSITQFCSSTRNSRAKGPNAFDQISISGFSRHTLPMQVWDQLKHLREDRDKLKEAWQTIKSSGRVTISGNRRLQAGYIRIPIYDMRSTRDCESRSLLIVACLGNQGY